MNFGKAIEALKKGKSVSRSGWNGKNMLIYLNKGNKEFEPVIIMFTAESKYQPGWLASQADILAEDWEIL